MKERTKILQKGMTMGNILSKIFVKDYENTGDPVVRERYGKFAGVVGIISNLMLCAAKILAGLFSGSIAIVADGVNNLADASSSIMTLVGFRLASLPEDEGHPYGHARIEYLTGLFISIFIMVIGAQLLKTSAGKIIHPDPLESGWLTIIILVAAILVKLWQSMFNIGIGKKIDSVTLMATGTDSRNDVIATSAVLVSVLIGKFTGVQTDGWMGCLVALFIIWSGIQLVRETSSPLLGEAPDRHLVEAIRDTIEREPGVLGVHDLMVHNYGPGRIFASIHIEVDADGDLLKSHDMIDNIERMVKKTLHIEFVAHMDPVVTNDPLIEKLKDLLTETFSITEGVDTVHDLRIVPGPTHTNVIFDVVLSPSCKYKESTLLNMANDAVRSIDPNYFAVVTFDKSYTPLD